MYGGLAVAQVTIEESAARRVEAIHFADSENRTGAAIGPF
jgi:hypothetical protein